MTKKLSREFVSKQATKTFKHSAKQSVEILKSSEEIKNLSPVFEKSSHMFEL